MTNTPEADEPQRVAMTDLGERLLAPNGADEAARLSGHLAALSQENAERLAAGAPPAEAVRRQTLGRALGAAEIIMQGIGRWAGSDSPSPVSGPRGT